MSQVCFLLGGAFLLSWHRLSYRDCAVPGPATCEPTPKPESDSVHLVSFFIINCYNPVCICCILGDRRSQLSNFFPQVVGNLVYYRYMNPAIVAPDGFDVVDRSASSTLQPEQRFILGSISRMLQHAAANKHFHGDGPHVRALNQYISQTHSRFRWEPTLVSLASLLCPLWPHHLFHSSCLTGSFLCVFVTFPSQRTDSTWTSSPSYSSSTSL